MVDRNKNERPRGRYFLDRRDYVRQSPVSKATKSQANSGPMFPSPPPEDVEVESKLQTLYNSLNTSFWDTEPKPKKRREKEADRKSRISVIGNNKIRDLRFRVFDSVTKFRIAAADKGYKSLLSQKRVAFPIVGVVAVLAIMVVFRGESTPDSGQIATVKGSSKINYDNAGYKPLLPEAATKRDAAESSLKYEPTKKVFTYNDTVSGGRVIIVSQQPLPGEYKKDPISGLGAVASNIGMSDWVASSKGKLYYGNNEAGEGQTAVFAYGNILILMRSNVAVQPNQWKNYADQLE